MHRAALVIGGPADRQAALVAAFDGRGVAAVAVPDAVSAMAALGRADFKALVIADGSLGVSAAGEAVSLKGLLRVARMRHPDVVAVLLLDADASSEDVEDVDAMILDAHMAPTAIAAVTVGKSSTTDPPKAPKPSQWDERTLVDDDRPALLEGTLGDEGGAAVLVMAFSQDLSGRLDVDEGPAQGALYFLKGEPVDADAADDETRASVRERVLALVDQRGGQWSFFPGKDLLEGRETTPVNPFGLVLEARRRRTPPADVLDLAEEIGGRYVVPQPGLDRAAPKLSAFARGVDVATTITGTTTARQVWEAVGLDPMMGALLVVTLEDTRLVRLEDAARATSHAALSAPRFETPPPSDAEPDTAPFDTADVAAAEALVPGRAPPPPPRVGRYELVELIGKGGMAEVHLGKQLLLDGFERRVAVKRILRELAADAELVEMFLDEARIAARLSHPNVVQILDLGKHGDDPYIVMEYVQGADLDTLIQAGAGDDEPCMPFEIAARVVADAASGLQAAHAWRDERGKPSPIIHRDVSPQNVLVSVDGHVKLSDFGVAKAAGSRAQTSPGQRKGKIPYSAPEYLKGAPATVRSDVFSLGIVLYQCIAREHPFARDKVVDSLQAILNGEMVPLDVHRPDIPPALDAIVRRALAVDPDERYESAFEMEGALETFLSDYGRPASSAFVAVWVELAMARAQVIAERRKAEKAQRAAAKQKKGDLVDVSGEVGSISLDGMAGLLRASVKTESGR